MRPLFLTLPFVFLIACQTPISNQNSPKAVGTVEVSIDLDNQRATASWQPRGIQTQAIQTTSSIQLLSNGQPLGFVSSAATSTDFISAKFNVSNLTANALTDVTLVAFHKSGNQSDTAIKNIVNFVGASLDNEVFARGIKPANMVTASMTLDAGNEDVQLFTEAEVSQLQTQASTIGEINTSANEYLFPYGYVSRATGSSTSRTLGAGANTGTLNIAIRIPNNNSAPNNSVRRFNMTFVAFDQPVATRISESLEEQGANSGAVTRANASNFNASRVGALQNSALHTANDGTKVNVCQVRTAGTATSPLARLETSTLASGSGTLDTCFAALGKRVLSQSGSPYSGKSLAQQADGKLVITGYLQNGATTDFLVARYNEDGSLDTTFGTNGQVLTDFSNSNEVGTAITLDNNQKIVVAGISDSKFAVARYNSNGTLDTSFDTDGKVTTDFGIGFSSSQANAIAVDSTNKIVVAGTAGKFAIAKYNTDGSLDTSFDGDGKFLIGVVATNDTFYALVIDGSDKIIAGGFSASSTRNFIVYRLNVNGSLDTSFNTTGRVETDFGTSNDALTGLSLDSNGKIIAVGSIGISAATQDFGIARYETNGSLDPTFGTSGKVISDLSGDQDAAISLVTDANGKLVVVGYSAGNAPSTFGYAVARYMSNGSLDTTFANNGKYIAENVSNVAKALVGVVLDSKQRIVTYGINTVTQPPPMPIYDFVIFRINP